MKTYKERAESHPNLVAKRLFEIIERKRSNLCISLDVTETEQLLTLADKCGPYICMVKTHIDILTDFSYEKTVKGLVELSQKHNFLIFEDRKFADIGNTVMNQYTQGMYKISSWSHITNAHPVPGPGIIQGLSKGAASCQEPRGLLLLAEMSSKGTLARDQYTRSAIEMAEDSFDDAFVFGFIAMSSVTPVKRPDIDWVVLTPGVGLDTTGDAMGQQYKPVDQVILGGSDVIIVGRGIYGSSKDPILEAKRYQQAGWSAYERRISS